MMVKVVKLNRRHKLFNELRMTHAWRFQDYGKHAKQIRELESFLRDHYGQQEWGWKYNVGGSFYKPKAWATHWTEPRRDRPRTYWVAVKEPEIVMMAKLAGIDF